MFIPEYAKDYKKEYLFIIGINKEFKYILDKLDDLNSGLFESNRVNRVKKIIKRYLRGKERGKLKDISKLVFNKYEIANIIKIKENFCYYKLKYDFCIEGDDGDYGFVGFDPYPGFKEVYDTFELFYNDIKYCSDSDSESESDSEFENVNVILPDSDIF